jgi:hypothetical protein
LPQAFPPLGPEYERFLYAVVCDEANGSTLTMVSAIARSGDDPWREAARIAKLPKAAAFEALARLIPDRGDAEKTAIANRLFALLPTKRQDHPSFHVAPSQNAGAATMKTTVAAGQNPLVLIVVVLMLGLFTALYFKVPHQLGADPQTQPTAPPAADKAEP